MAILSIIVQLILLAFLPLWLVRINRKMRTNHVLSDVVFCYLVGILFANTQWLAFPAGDFQTRLFETSKTAVEISVLLAIPMLLMTMHLAQWLRYTGGLLRAFLLGSVSVFVTALAVSYWYKDSLPNHAESMGMLAAVYIGGTPNMAAVGKMVDPTGNLFGILNTIEMFWGGLYFLFLTGLAPSLYKNVLRPFVYKGRAEIADDTPEAHEYEPQPWTKQRFQSVGIGIATSLLIIGISVGLALLIPDNRGKLNEPILMLSLTTLGIAASMIRAIRERKGVYEFAQYLLLIFALAAGSIADFSQIALYGWDYIAITALCLFPAVLLHLFLCKLFGIDRDTYMITSCANIFGPPFIGQVASAVKNKEIIAGGIAMGSLGLALGNYWGVLVAEIGKWF